MARKISYFRDGDQIIAVTDESPPQFKDVLFIGKSMIGDKVTEAVFTPDQVQAFEPIAKCDMPAAWIVSFGYEKPEAPKPQAPKPEKRSRKPKQEQPPEPETTVIDVRFPWEPRTGPAGCLPQTILECVAAIAAIVVFTYFWILLNR